MNRFHSPYGLPDRRGTARSHAAMGALIYHDGRRGVHACTVRDLSEAGLGIRLSNIALLPVKFKLSFDNFRTTWACQLVWREGDFLGARFELVN